MHDVAGRDGAGARRRRDDEVTGVVDLGGPAAYDLIGQFDPDLLAQGAAAGTKVGRDGATTVGALAELLPAQCQRPQQAS